MKLIKKIINKIFNNKNKEKKKTQINKDRKERNKYGYPII